MASTIATFYVAGGTVGLFIVWGGDGHGFPRTLLLILALSAYPTALAISRWARAWPRHAFHFPMVAAAVLIVTSVLLATDPSNVLLNAALMSFVVFDAYVFFSLPVATLYMVVAPTCLTVALLVQGETTMPTALGLDTMILALGTVSRSLVLRASGATRDPLTDLLNRRGFDQNMQELIIASERTGSQLSAALLDLDAFKAINDTWGHDAGDRVLRRVADVWWRALPPRGVLARHGGDEFAVLLPGYSGQDALRLVRDLSALHPDVRLSVGVAEYARGESAAHLMRRADQALYMAKAAGRGRCELAGRAGPLRAGGQGGL